MKQWENRSRLTVKLIGNQVSNDFRASKNVGLCIKMTVIAKQLMQYLLNPLN